MKFQIFSGRCAPENGGDEIYVAKRRPSTKFWLYIQAVEMIFAIKASISDSEIGGAIQALTWDRPDQYSFRPGDGKRLPDTNSSEQRGPVLPEFQWPEMGHPALPPHSSGGK